jgi:hypothetical protein
MNTNTDEGNDHIKTRINLGNVIILFMFQDNEHQDAHNVNVASSWYEHGLLCKSLATKCSGRDSDQRQLKKVGNLG